MEKEKVLKQMGSAIRHLRKSYSLTIRELASRAKINEKYLLNVELGKRNISVLKLNDVAKSLNVSIEEIFREHSQN